MKKKKGKWSEIKFTCKYRKHCNNKLKKCTWSKISKCFQLNCTYYTTENNRTHKRTKSFKKECPITKKRVCGNKRTKYCEIRKCYTFLFRNDRVVKKNCHKKKKFVLLKLKKFVTHKN